jgi:methylmalonyl-CoA/ethylmalonyl-CoA epimerase
MIGPVHHIGIAVKRLEPAIEQYRKLGLEPESVEVLPSQDVRLAFLAPGTPRIELVEPLSRASPVARFLAKRGEGLHHLAFSTDDIAATLHRVSEDGFELVDRTPRLGAHGRMVAFLNPRSAHGVLIELVQGTD